ICAEFECDFTDYPGGTSDIAFEFFSNGTTGYQLRVRATDGANWMALYKMDGTLVQDGTVTHAGTLLNVPFIIYVYADGAGNITASFGGEEQIDVSGETTYTSGTQIAFSGLNIT